MGHGFHSELLDKQRVKNPRVVSASPGLILLMSPREVRIPGFLPGLGSLLVFRIPNPAKMVIYYNHLEASNSGDV